MRKRERFRQAAYTRFHALCVDNRGTLEATSGGKQAVADLGASVTAADQRSADHQQRLEEERVAVADCRTWRGILLDVLQAIVEASHHFVMPADGAAEVMLVPGRENDEMFLADARAIRDKVKQYEAQFLTLLHPDVLNNLSLGIDRLAAARLARDKARALRVAARQSLREDLTTSKANMNLLHTIVETTPGVDPNVVNAFRAAKRVGPSKPKEEAPAQPDPAPVATAKTA